MKLKIVLIGKRGMLGHDVFHVFEHAGHTVFSLTTDDVDISSADSVKRILGQYTHADYVINCAAYTKVDLAETERELAFAVNADGPKNLAAFCKSAGIPLIHFSTDYVFNGQGETPYTEDAATDPVNAYGASKLAGEIAIQDSGCDFYIFRVQWLYGKNGKHFVDTISNLAKTRDQLTIIADQWGSPTWTVDIAKMLDTICVKKPPFGIYHFASEGYTNWADFARHFLQIQNSDCQISDILTSDYPTPAKRPHNSRLDLSKIKSTGIKNVPKWTRSLDHFLST